MSQFFTLPALKSLVAGRRSDLAALRKLANDTNAKVAKLEDTRFSYDYVTKEQGLTREDASKKATTYLEDHATFTHFESIQKQSEFWSVGQFLARSAGAPNDQIALLKNISLLLALPRMTVATIRQTADAAVLERNWNALGCCFNELTFRSLANDGDAMATKSQLEQMVEIPDIAEAEGLIAEGAQLREFCLYTLQAIATGIADLGVRMEKVAAIERERDPQQRVRLQQELTRQADTVEWQRAS